MKSDRVTAVLGLGIGAVIIASTLFMLGLVTYTIAVGEPPFGFLTGH